MFEVKQKPVPRPAPESAPYWAAARERRLSLPKCEDCEGNWFPPSRTCPHCLPARVTFADVSGRGKVYSFVTFHRVYHPGFEGDVPYVVALIELEEGPRLLSNVIGVAHEDVRCEMPVEVVFEDVGEAKIPKFRPRAA